MKLQIYYLVVWAVLLVLRGLLNTVKIDLQSQRGKSKPRSEMKRKKGHAGLGLEIIAERQVLAGKWEKGKGWEIPKSR